MNKYQEAIDRVARYCSDVRFGNIPTSHKLTRNELGILMELVERAIPKKPKYIRNRIGDYEYICSNCGERFPYTRNCIDQHKYEYCPYCGKKTDWSDE